jgi:hypothetical protein
VHPPLYPDAVMCRNPTVSLRSGVTRKETVFSGAWAQAINASKG